MHKAAMEAKNATDCPPWRDGIDPRALNRVSGAIAELARPATSDPTMKAADPHSRIGP